VSDKQTTGTTPDTGHVWDGNLRELTNQPPRWWMITFYLSGLFIIVYLVLYPSIPLIHGATKGILGWTQMKRMEQSVEQIQAIRAPYENRVKTLSAAEILADPQLSEYVVVSAKVLFGDRCSPCHGAGGSGNPGFPVLADDDWLYGGTIQDIQQSITEGRTGMMPAYGSMLSTEQINELVQYVQSLSQKTGGQEAGKELFTNYGCGGCHGEDGKGIQAMGAANLTDAIWRFAPGNAESIKDTIVNGVNDSGAKDTRVAVMPSFKNQLSESDIKKLAVYVYKLGGGQ
jgi:cytochrome c oxidase cbb3-type subunit 3